MMVEASEITFRRTIKRYSTRRTVGVATLGDRLALTITSTLLMDVDRAESDRAATAFLLSGVKHLELSVRQEVASVAARSCLSIDDRTSRTPFAHMVRL